MLLLNAPVAAAAAPPARARASPLTHQERAARVRACIEGMGIGWPLRSVAATDPTLFGGCVGDSGVRVVSAL